MDAAKSEPAAAHVQLIIPQRRLRHLTHLCGFNLRSTAVQQQQGPTAVYFTLHDDPHRPAFYASEKCIDIVSPQWRRFDFSQFTEGTSSSLSHIFVKVWMSDDVETLIFNCHVRFGSLVCLGNQIPKCDRTFMPNSLVLGMQESFYSPAGCYKSGLTSNSNRTFSVELPVDPQMIHMSYDISTVTRIHMIQRAIKQTQASIWKYRNQIQEQLKQTRRNEEKRLHEYVRMTVHFLHEELQAQKIQIVIGHDQLLKLQSKVNEKAKKLKANMEQLKEAQEKFRLNHSLFVDKRESLLKTNAELQLCRRQLVSELANIYPICEVNGKGVTICGVVLPNSEDFAGQDETRIAVALGYVLHLVSMIAQFLDVPLRYPVSNFGSRSTIKDHILDKIPDSGREFPLFTKGREKWHFNYGVYLLNKNIAQLRYYCGILTQDLRATLPNLQGLLELQQKMKFDFPAAGSLILGPARMMPPNGQEIILLSPKRQLCVKPKPPSCFYPNVSHSVSGTLTNDHQLDSVLMDMQASCYRDIPSAVRTTTGNTALSYSLDKGLDELNVSKCHYLQPRLQWHNAIQTHGSEPNLMQHQVARTKAEVNGECNSENNAKFFKPPSEMWATGSSQTNSEEEVSRATDDSGQGSLLPL